MRRLLPLAALAATAAFFVPSGVAVQQASVVLVNQKWTCHGQVDLDLVHVVRNDGRPIDAVAFGTGCTGVIRNLQVFVANGADGVKVQNASLTDNAHDLVIERAYIRVLDHPLGVHQDGMQIMSGTNIVFKRLICYAPRSALGCFAVSRAGHFIADPSTNPRNVICEHCMLGPVKGLRIGASVSSGARDVWTCGKSVTAAAVTPVVENVAVFPANDPHCQP